MKIREGFALCSLLVFGLAFARVDFAKAQTQSTTPVRAAALGAPRLPMGGQEMAQQPTLSESTTPLPTSEAPIFERSLLALAQSLQRSRHLQGMTLRTTQDFWEHVGAARLADALRRASGETETGGALIAAGHFISTAQKLEPKAVGTAVHLAVPALGVSIPVANFLAAEPCRSPSLSTDAVRDGELASQYITCLFENGVRRLVAGQSIHQKMALTHLSIPHDTIQRELEVVAAELAARRIIDRFALALVEGSGKVWARGASRDAPFNLRLDSASVETAQSADELAGERVLQTSSLLATGYILYNKSLGLEGHFVSRGFLEHALAAGTGAASGAEREEVLAAAFSLPSSRDSASECEVDNRRYDTPGLITPRNNHIAVLRGPDTQRFFSKRTSLSDYQLSLAQELESTGYRVSYLDLDRENGDVGTTNLSEAYCALKNAHSLMIINHGSPDGSSVIDLSFGESRRLCCERLKQHAKELGIELPSNFCLRPGVPPTEVNEPSDEPFVWDSPPRRRLLSSFGDGVRCGIQLDGEALFRYLGNKAVVFSEQCFGGRLSQGRLGHLAEQAVADLFVRSNDSNSTYAGSCAYQTLAKDLSGSSHYCEDGEGKIIEQFDGTNCTPMSSLMRMSPSVQGSVLIRGAFGTDVITYADREEQNDGSMQLNCDRYYSMDPDNPVESRREISNLDNNGWRKLASAQLGGNPEVEVTFNPRVADVRFDEMNRKMQVVFDTAVDPESIGVSFEAVQCPTLTSASPEVLSGGGDAVLRFAERVEFSLSQGLPLAGKDFWVDERGELTNLAADGWPNTQHNWPSFVRIRIAARAPNGVALVGNSQQDKPWLFPGLPLSNAPAWSVFNGAIKKGDDLYFEVRIPCKPPVVCNAVNYDGSTCQQPNGVTCSGVNAPRLCTNGESIIWATCETPLDQDLAPPEQCLIGTPTFESQHRFKSWITQMTSYSGSPVQQCIADCAIG